MHVLLENLGKLERRLTARISDQQIELQVRARLRELGRTVQIKGFRPGKVPANVIEQRFGAQVRGEVIADAITASWDQAVQQENLRPALAPSIRVRPLDDGSEIEFTADFEVLPQLGQLDIEALSLSRFVASVEEADVDHILDSLEVDESGVLRVRAEIRANLERDLAVTVAAITRVGVLEQLVATYSDFDLPKGLVELEIKARSASSSADELSTNTPPADDPKRLDDAQSRVRAFILLAEVARQNSITPEQSRINTTLAEIASDYDEPRKVVELYARDSELMATLRNRVIEEQTIDWLLANARVSEHRLSTAEVMQAQP